MTGTQGKEGHLLTLTAKLFLIVFPESRKDFTKFYTTLKNNS